MDREGWNEVMKGGKKEHIKKRKKMREERKEEARA